MLFDVQSDAVADPGDMPIGGVDLSATWAGPDGIWGTRDEVVYTATTGADGSYSFALLPPGAYQLAVDAASLPAGLAATFDPDGGTLGFVTATVSAGSTLTDLYFGYAGTGSIGDQVWFDVDGDGVEDGSEPDLHDIAVALHFARFDHVFGTADDVEYVALTVVGNGYLFPHLAAGDYELTVDVSTLPGGLVATYDLDGGLDSISVAALGAGENRRDVDFGYTGTGSIGQNVWVDADGDGTLEPGELGMAGVGVVLTWAGQDGLFGTADDFEMSTVSASDGSYAFANLPAGSYSIKVLGDTLATGYGPTTTLSYVVTLGPGLDHAAANFGFVAEALPRTGSDTGGLVSIAIQLILAGLVLVAGRRRRAEGA